MRRFAAVSVFLLATAGALGAQAVVDSGMTKAQVIEKLGKPLVERTKGSSTFLYYANGDEKKMGMNDVVVLVDGKVVDAVFRSSARRYTGKSSSPAAVPVEVARKRGRPEKAGDTKAPDKKIDAKKANTSKAGPTKKP